MSNDVESRLSEIGISIPDVQPPVANYLPFVQHGNQLWISGQVSRGANGVEFLGKCGADRSIEEGRKAAELCALNVLAQAKSALGDLDRISRIIKLVGFVNSTPEFCDQPKVVNGASDFIVKALGDKGRHARSAVGVAALPLNVTVEVEAVIEILEN